MTDKSDQPATTRSVNTIFVVTMFFIAFCAIVLVVFLGLPMKRIESMKPCATSGTER